MILSNGKTLGQATADIVNHVIENGRVVGTPGSTEWEESLIVEVEFEASIERDYPYEDADAIARHAAFAYGHNPS